jgi:hypothetical protein
MFYSMPGPLCLLPCARSELVMAGPTGWASPATIERLRTVRYLGYVPEQDLAPLTAAAAAFVYPSLYEAAGKPARSSHSSSSRQFFNAPGNSPTRPLTEVNSRTQSDGYLPADLFFGYASLCRFSGAATVRERFSGTVCTSAMSILGILLFVLIFVMIGSGSRAMVVKILGGADEWIVKYAPLSYLILVVIVVVPVAAAIVVWKWPVPPEPENPLARFKHEDVMED